MGRWVQKTPVAVWERQGRARVRNVNHGAYVKSSVVFVFIALLLKHSGCTVRGFGNQGIAERADEKPFGGVFNIVHPHAKFCC
ncbi:hypothetical protein M011DRAFT_420206, partial [Sporormia fimetaria CBS 119925]